MSRNLHVPDVTSDSLHGDVALGWTVAVFCTAHIVGKGWEEPRGWLTLQSRSLFKLPLSKHCVPVGLFSVCSNCGLLCFSAAGECFLPERP